MGDFEADVRRIGKGLYARAAGVRPQLYRGLTGSLLESAMADARLRDALFQLVDALPQLRDRGDIARHLAAYLAGVPHRGWQGWLLDLAARPSLAWSVRLLARRLARRFLAEESAAGVGRVLARLARVPATATFDAVGEAVLAAAEAEAYLARNLALLEWLPEGAGAARPQLSLKLTALTARFDALDAAGTRKRVFARLEPLLAAAARRGAMVTVDMEHHKLKPLILDLFVGMAAEFPGDWLPAVALQAYLPETPADAERILRAAGRSGRRLGVRLVKGAYWDQEAAWAAQRNWPRPTFADKAATDAQFETLTTWLLERADALFPAIASHNLRSQAVALACARRLGLGPEAWQAQLLHGMAEPLRDALAAEGAPLCIYVPTGDLAGGIAYLIRRLLENTASTSVLRQSYVEGVSADAMLAQPLPQTPRPDDGIGLFNLPLLDFSRDAVSGAFAAALARVRATLPRRHALGNGGAPVGVHVARNPAHPDEVLGASELAGRAHVDAAVAAARAAFPVWRDTPASARCGALRRAAAAMAGRRHELAALEVLEQAKPWREADADVAEAVDFLRYYADAMEQLAGWRDTVSFPGECNQTGHEPRGVAVVIAPWNFPLAILAGMTAAALAAGNAVIMKPALPALLVAHEFQAILREAGVPRGVAELLPGDAEAGAALVAHRDTHLIAFTGSRRVGLDILHDAHTPAPGQRHVKQVVCEMGGKNAIVVDADADLDEAVAGILASAFGYSGQKCSAASRVIAVADVHDRLLARLCDAAAALAWGPPEDPAFDHGPLITAAARDKALGYIAIGSTEGSLAWQGDAPLRHDGGWYVPPAVFAGIEPGHRLAREEIFGPVLAVMRAANFTRALEMAMDSDYGLTGGVFSRYPPHLALARDGFRVGNLYLNRRITGARVGIQPFGGIALSGTGVQAGGPDYLKQFLWNRCVSTNTQRHGLLPGQAGA